MTHLMTESPSGTAARRMFQRVLSNWAMDYLALRRAGLDRPSMRRGWDQPERPAASSADRRRPAHAR